jgi:hypothetical protein
VKRIHFLGDGITVANVTLVGVADGGEPGTIDVADDVAVGPGMVRIGDGFALPPVLITSSDVDARAQQAFDAGFAPSHANFAGERLQMRDTVDRTNWLALQIECNEAIAAGDGNVVNAGFRTASNAMIVVSYHDGKAVLLELLGWSKSILANAWKLKDQLAAGEPIDMESGWH